MKKLTLLLSVFVSAVLSLSAAANTLTGIIKDSAGEPLNGVMVRATDAQSIVSEVVFTNTEGEYTLQTILEGDLSVRARLPYFKDVTTSVSLDGKANLDLSMEPMTDLMEISNSLPAAYHFGSLPFEEGANDDFGRAQFQRDCLSCHQMGNNYSRHPGDEEYWLGTIIRMHRMYGSFDEELRDRRVELLAEGFKDEPLMLRPEFPIDPALETTKIYEYALTPAYVPHDAIIHPVSGKIYTVDQVFDHMVVTDPDTGQSKYVQQRDSLAMKYHLGSPILSNDDLGDFDPDLSKGPHSLSMGLDGKYYVTNTADTSIGVFNPEIDQWEPSFKIPEESGARYPHTLRTTKSGDIWITFAGSEHVAKLDPTTGEFTVLDLPPVKGNGVLSEATQPYGIDIHPEDDSIWYGRLFADKVGRVDPETLEITEYDTPVRGPRRMRFDDAGILWVAGYSEGELARVDVSNGFDAKVYVMPSFAEDIRVAPYALGVHPITQDIWINENMTDRIYRFIPDEERFVVYPMPLSGTYTRDMTFSENGQVCSSNNPLPPAALEGGVLEIFCIDPTYDPSGESESAAVAAN